MNFITQYCRIRDCSIAVGKDVVYERHSSDLDAFLNDAIKGLSIAYPKYYKMDRLSKLGFLAAEMLLKDSGVVDRYGSKAVAVVLTNAHASLDTDIRYFETARTIASPALFVYTLANIVTGEICIRHGIKGENAFFISDRFDSELLASYVERVMMTEKTQACLAGWVDVLGEDHDVFLYLTEKTSDKNNLEHDAQNLRELYLG